MRNKTLQSIAWLLFCMYSTTEAERNLESGSALNISNTFTTASENNTHHQIQKRQDGYYPEYPNAYDYDYSEPGVNYPVYDPSNPQQESNYLLQGSNYLGIAGGTGLALKAAKRKLKLKGLKLLAVPAGIALLGAVLASGIIPPTAIGGINLPFQGKRRKREVNDIKFKLPDIYKRRSKFSFLQNFFR